MFVSRVWLVVAVLLLSACQSAGSRSGFYDSPLQPGDEVEILRDVEVPAGKARVYLQHGALTSYGASDQYAPFCYFLLRDPLPQPQLIRPGVLDVTKVWLEQETVSRDSPVRLASLFGFGDGDRSMMAWQFHIALRAADRSRLTLVCSGAFDGPVSAQPIRLPQVREALGNYAAVRVRG